MCEWPEIKVYNIQLSYLNIINGLCASFKWAKQLLYSDAQNVTLTVVLCIEHYFKETSMTVLKQSFPSISL